MRITCGLALGLLAPTAVAAQQPQAQKDPTWAQMPRMQLERQFAGPLQDTIVQRWRDPTDGTLCYIYLPITASHSAPAQSGYVQYGASAIGSISCHPGAPAAPARTRKPAAKSSPPPVPITPEAEKEAPPPR